MRIYLIPALFFYVITPAFAADGRDDIIGRQLDCVDQNLKTSTVGWSDVCYMGSREDHAQVVTAALDTLESSQSVSQKTPENVNTTAPADQVPAQKPSHFFEEGGDLIKQHLNPRKIHTIDMGVDPYFYRYKENIGVKIGGMMVGYFANYAYRPEDENFLNNFLLNTYMLEGRMALGGLHYKSGSGTINNEHNINFEIRTLIGKEFLFENQLDVTPYGGFGYRYLFDQGRDVLTSLGAVGYDRRSNYYYLPLGINASLPSGDWLNTLNFEYDVFLSGVQYSDLSDVNPYTASPYPNIKNDQKHGYGVRGSWRFTYIKSTFNFYIEPYFRYWSIENSKPAFYTQGGTDWVAHEPKNQTIELGSKLGIVF